MRNKFNVLASVGLLVISVQASAVQMSGTVAVTSDYLVDGVTQTNNDPALQLGLTAAFDSGLYMYVWGSQVDFGTGFKSNAETDWAIGYAGGGENISFDVALIGYLYLPNGDGFNFAELSGAITAYDTTFKALLSNSYAGSGIASARLKLNHSFAINDSWSVPLELGYDVFADPFDFGYAISDGYGYYKLGLGYTIKNWSFEASWNQSSLKAYPGVEKKTVSENGNFVFMITYAFDIGMQPVMEETPDMAHDQ